MVWVDLDDKKYDNQPLDSGITIDKNHEMITEEMTEEIANETLEEGF
jgi:uncharacterized protein YpmB